MAYTSEQLLDMPAADLDKLFSGGAPGPIPAGEAEGTAIIAPGTPASPVIAHLIHAFAWKGKVFDAEKGQLLNKLFPVSWDLVAAKVYEGESWYDKKPCVVLDYSHTSVVAHWIRDEIRLIGPGLYLGKVYGGQEPLFHFTLQF